MTGARPQAARLAAASVIAGALVLATLIPAQVARISVAQAAVASRSAEASSPAGSSIPSGSVASSATTVPAEWPLRIKKFLGRPIHSVVTRKRQVALTFDDGPSSHCESITATLARAGVHATFFFCGRSVRGPGVRYVRDAALARDDIGNHTFHHVELRNISAKVMRSEVEGNQAALKGATGFAPRFLRPRSGIYRPAALRLAKVDGLALILWSVSGGDAGARPPVATIVRNATRNAKPGSIILLHETNPDTSKALPAILRALKRKGLEPVTISRLLADAKSVR